MKDKQREELVNRKHEEWVNGYWKLPSRVGVDLFEYTKNFIRTLLNEASMFFIGKNWRPSAENIKALPEPVRKYIYELEMNTDPPTLVRENVVLKENCKALEMMKKPKASKAFVGKVTARIYCDRKSVRAIKKHIREAFEEKGFEVEK